MNHVVLISGLGSSLPLFGGRYRKWAKQLQARLGKLEYTSIYEVSSDGAGEKPALQAILRDKMPGKIIIVGHSNGARDALFMTEILFRAKLKVNYVACLDMTLGEFGAKAFGNIQFLDEFHARLETVDFDKTFVPNGANYHKWEIDRGHVAMASDERVQNRLYQKITEVLAR